MAHGTLVPEAVLGSEARGLALNCEFSLSLSLLGGRGQELTQACGSDLGASC